MFGGVVATTNLVIGITIAIMGAFLYMGSKAIEVPFKKKFDKVTFCKLIYKYVSKDTNETELKKQNM